MNEQTKHKISMALRGRKKSAVTRKRISQAMKRYRKTPQHKQAIAEAMRTVWLVCAVESCDTFSSLG